MAGAKNQQAQDQLLSVKLLPKLNECAPVAHWKTAQLCHQRADTSYDSLTIGFFVIFHIEC